LTIPIAAGGETPSSTDQEVSVAAGANPLIHQSVSPHSSKPKQDHCRDLHENRKPLQWSPMKFALAILVFVLFAFFISAGIIELFKGQPWILVASLVVFFGTFVKYGCRSH
jgi:hypothetical protein